MWCVFVAFDSLFEFKFKLIHLIIIFLKLVFKSTIIRILHWALNNLWVSASYIYGVWEEWNKTQYNQASICLLEVIFRTICCQCSTLKFHNNRPLLHTLDAQNKVRYGFSSMQHSHVPSCWFVMFFMANKVFKKILKWASWGHEKNL